MGKRRRGCRRRRRASGTEGEEGASVAVVSGEDSGQKYPVAFRAGVKC